jgi:putative CRISPR-associated protein (TIGR02619 family)
MNKKIDVITTVGMSLISNYIEKEKYSDSKTWNDNKNKKFNNELWNTLSRKILNTLKTNILKWNYADKQKCAELKTLLLLKEQAYKINEIHLVYTDTIGGKFASEILEELLKKEDLKFNVASNEKIEGLNFENNGDEFEKTGFNQLITRLDNIKSQRQKENKNTKESIEIGLNISGGYKALIPFLTIYAQLVEIPLFYVYEDSAKLITINPAPLKFDWAIADIYYQYLTDSELREKMSDESDIIVFLKSNHLITSQKKLTVIGSLFEAYIKQYLPQRKDVIGHYIEHKLFEAFFEDGYNGFKSNKIGLKYWWSVEDKSVYSVQKMYDGDDKLEKPVEIDLQLTKGNEKIWIECKPISNVEKAVEQVKRYVEFNELALKTNLNGVAIFIYKFQFQSLNTKRTLIENTKKYFQAKNLSFEVHFFDIPFNPEKGTITYKKLFETKLKLNENLKTL